MTGTPLAPSQETPKNMGLTLGQRIAGVVLLINSLAVAAEGILSPAEMTSRTISSTVVSAVLGVLLLINQVKALTWAKFSVILGAVFFTTMYAVRQDYLMIGFQIAFSAGLLMLLFGQAGRVRIGIASVLFLAYFLLEAAGLQEGFTGKNFLGGAFMRMNFKLTELSSSELHGENAAYTLTVSKDHWRLRDRKEFEQERPEIDQWLVNPEHTAHLFTIVDITDPDKYFELKRLVDVVIENGEQGSEKFVVNERHPLESHPGIGEFVDANVTVDKEKFHFYYGIFAMNRHAVQVVCYSYDDIFPHVQNDCLDAIRSFSAPTLVVSENKTE